jgi:hypothetical protein
MAISRKKAHLLSFIVLVFAMYTSTHAQTTTIIPPGSSWKYLDNGTDQGTAWRAGTFNDSGWAQGNAELGYGDNDETTLVAHGPDPNNAYITTYFRKAFTVSNPAAFTELQLEVLRDDGAVVYINGIEVWRSNMPANTINYQTLASSAIAWPNETSWHQFTISPLYLVPGNNVIAVEIHQSDPGTSDLSFNLKMDAGTSLPNVSVDRGPYLQMATENSIIIKWRTSIATDSKVMYGTNLGSLTQQSLGYDFTTEHEVHLSGLNPSTSYYYTIGNNFTTFVSEASDVYFKTSPVTGAIAPYRFWVIGDAGMGDNNQRAVRDGFYGVNNHQHIDGWIMLGDNAYGNGVNDGNQNCYQTGVFQNMYENILKNTVLWPAPGNHDYNNHIPFSAPPAYYDIFTLPANAEAGGVPSGTEKYYSYNYGNIHFIILDSYDESRSATGAMAQWLQSDLAADTMAWTIAYWHHPPYTKGSHDSDNGNLLNGELVEMRENILPIIEAGGVDLVLNGHSHCYERSYLIDGHYNYSTQLQPSMILDTTSGSYSQACAYHKYTQESKAHQGTVYAVVGCSGKLSGTSQGWPHPVMYKATNTDLGSMLLEVNNNRLDAKFLLTDGSTYDSFTILKNAGEKKSLNICTAEQISLHPSFPGSVLWSPGGSTLDSLVLTPTANQLYTATNLLTCERDAFYITINTNPPCPTGITNHTSNNISLSVFPSLVSGQEIVTVEVKVNTPQSFNLKIIDVNGRTCHTQPIECKQTEQRFSIPAENLKAGTYFMEITNTKVKKTQKFNILRN